jgi:hypothetical protein
VQRGDLVVELVATFIETAGTICQYLLQCGLTDFTTLACQFRSNLQQGQRAPHVAICCMRNLGQKAVVDEDAASSQATLGIL